MRSRHNHRGTTLLELIVALAITGLAMLGGILLLDQVNDGGRRIDRESRRHARDSNGDRLLRRLLLDARQTSDTADRFRGDERNLSYLALCDTPSGWPEECRALLSISARGDSSFIVAQTSPSARFEVRRAAGPAAFRYLDPTRARDSAWLQRWTPSIALPAAVALVGVSDTTVFPLGSTRE